MPLFDVEAPASRELPRTPVAGGVRPARLAAQPVLFGLTAEQQRHRDALTCLRDAVPDALEVVVDLEYRRDTDTRAPGMSGSWAYCACRAGLRFEPRNENWGGAPAHLVTWDELTALVGQDPRRAEVAAWVESLPMPRWKLLMRPHELWPDPEGWHVSYFCRDHVHDQWTARRRMWQLVLDLLTEAIEGIAAPGQDGVR